uniref:Uncharacterized protein n=1 Tax=Aegilops tauschii subsp. strangulata TaxID=200361 RepID=A0A453NZU1_AEGTS
SQVSHVPGAFYKTTRPNTSRRTALHCTAPARETDQKVETPGRKEMSYYGQQQAPVGAPPQQGMTASFHQLLLLPFARRLNRIDLACCLDLPFSRLPAAGVPSGRLPAATAGLPAGRIRPAGLPASTGLPAPAAAAEQRAFLHARMPSRALLLLSLGRLLLRTETKVPSSRALELINCALLPKCY